MSTTRAAVLTAPGRGAIAVVRVWGAGAVAVVDGSLRPRTGPSLAATGKHRPRLGRIGRGLGDDVIAVIVDGTGPPEVEVQCHGGTAAVQLVLEALADQGARIATAEEWARSRGLARVSAEAAIDLPHAETLRTAGALLDQAHGALAREIGAIRDTIATAGPEADATKPIEAIDRLLERAAVGTRLVRGWSAALAGRPNVGKSCLLNAIVGFDRAIVSPTPGTTRDVVTARIACDGWPVEIADTAGLRGAEDEIEARGVALSRRRHEASDLVVVALDGSEPLTGEDLALVRAHPNGPRVATKADLPARWDAAELDALPVSSLTGVGIDTLIGRLAERLVPAAPPPGSALPFRASQVERLRRVRALLRGGRPEAARNGLDWLCQPHPGATA